MIRVQQFKTKKSKNAFNRKGTSVNKVTIEELINICQRKYSIKITFIMY